MPVKDKKKKTKKVADSSTKTTSKSTVIIINEKPKRRRRNTKRKTETTQILQPVHVHQPYYFNPYEFHYPQAPQKVMEVNRQAAIDTLDQNKSEEVKATLASLGFIPPENKAGPSEIKNESDATPKLNRRLSMNPLYQEPAGGMHAYGGPIDPFSTGFTLSPLSVKESSRTPSISSDGYKPNLSISDVHAIGSYVPNKLDKLKKNFEELTKIAGTPGKKTVFNPHLVKIGKELVETFEGNPDLNKMNNLIKKIESGGRPNYKELELELRSVFAKDANLMNKKPHVNLTSAGNL
jgi:hypothetical protein